MQIEERKTKYNKLYNKLLLLNENSIKKLTNKKLESNETVKWGETGVITIDDIKVFYKKIPLAKLFEENQLDTSNLYDLPVYYNYGFGSAGINPWRELITHINLSNYVLAGESTHFPILYHWRVIQDNKKNFESGLIPKLLNRFGNHQNIKKYLSDRLNCEYKIVLFLEYIPYVLYKYIEEHPNYIKTYLMESKQILDFLNSKGILHMDAHWGNYLVDNQANLYLTDFGLVLDKNFDLDLDEKKFMQLNKKIPEYYFYESVYSFINYLALENSKLKQLFNDELKKKLGKINYTIAFIKSIKYILQILKLPKIYEKIIKTNKNLIIKIIKLKLNLENSKDKNIYL